MLIVNCNITGDISYWIYIWRWETCTPWFWSFLWIKLCCCTWWKKDTSMFFLLHNAVWKHSIHCCNSFGHCPCISFYNTNRSEIITSPPGGVWSIMMSMSVCLVCLSVCLSVCVSACISLKLHGQTSLNFYSCCRWPWLGPPLMALWYVMYFWLQLEVRKNKEVISCKTSTAIGMLLWWQEVP